MPGWYHPQRSTTGPGSTLMFDNTGDEWPLSDHYHFVCMCQHFLRAKLTEMDKELKERVTSHDHILETRLNRPGPHTN